MTQDAPQNSPAPASRWWIVALVIDALAVVGFAASGRASHREDVWGGIALTAWPFLLALLIGWLVSRGWRAPWAPVRTGLPVWAVTVAGGLLLRWLVGQGVAVPFIVVATLVLGALLVGWRLIALAISALRRRARR